MRKNRKNIHRDHPGRGMVVSYSISISIFSLIGYESLLILFFGRHTPGHRLLLVPFFVEIHQGIIRPRVSYSFHFWQIYALAIFQHRSLFLFLFFVEIRSVNIPPYPEDETSRCLFSPIPFFLCSGYQSINTTPTRLVPLAYARVFLHCKRAKKKQCW